MQKSIKMYFKRCRSTGMFFNNSAIILKLVWPEKTNLLEACGSTCKRKRSWDMKRRYFSVLFYTVYAHQVPLAKMEKFILQVNYRGWPWVMRVDSASLLCECLRGTQLRSLLMYPNVKLVFAKMTSETSRTRQVCTAIGSNHPLLKKYKTYAYFGRTAWQSA